MATVTLEPHEFDGDLLPLICCRCGDQSTSLSKQTYTWVPKWVFLFFVLCLPVFFLLSVILIKRKTIHLPTCDRHYSLSLARRLLATIGTIIFSCAFVWFMIFQSMPFEWEKNYAEIIVPAQIFLIGVGALLIFISAFVSVRAAKITHDTITLKGVSRHFADSVEQYRILLEEFESTQ